MTQTATPFSRRRFLSAAAQGAAALAAGACALPFQRGSGAGAAKFEGTPNFIVILTDDQGYQDLGCYGSPLIRTPRLDRMASEGVKFTDFCMAAPVCTPSRAALLTGCYPVRVSLPNVIDRQSAEGLHENEITIASLLKTRGYATGCIGKWHLGWQAKFLPTHHGFDYYYGIPYSNDMDFDNSTGLSALPLMRGEEIIERPVVQDTLTQRYTAEAIGFIEKNKTSPFFLYLPHTFPHIPLHASPDFKGRSPRGPYGDAIEEIDWSVGQILDTLKRLGLDEKTLVIFTSDNGPWNSHGEEGGSAEPLRGGKGSAWEGGFRVPFIARWPGQIPSGAVCSEPAASIDILPTLARLAGTRPPSDRIIDGGDIWPLLARAHGARCPREAFFYYTRTELQAVRSGRWKLTLGKLKLKPKPGTKDTTWANNLFDLRKDPGETRDVADQHPKIVARLTKLAERCREDLGDEFTGAQGKNIRPAGEASEAESATGT